MTIPRHRYHLFLTVPVLIMLLLAPRFCPAGNSAGNAFSTGRQDYEAGHYERALDAFLQAVEMEPDNAVYHHWLGKCYGRLAQSSGILKAYALSKKTRSELERAVELDDTNIDALADLMQFYRQAPGFLGGGADKAEAVCRRIKELQPAGDPESTETHSRIPEKC